MSTYPIVLIPYDLHYARTSKPAKPIFNEYPPAAPGEELNPDSLDKAIIWTSLISGWILSLIFLGINFFLGNISFLVTLYVTYLFYIKAKGTKAQRMKEYRAKKIEYERKLSTYHYRKQKFEEEAFKIQSPEQLAQYQLNLIKDILKQTVSADGSNSKAPKGYSEARFYNQYLSKHFPGKIHTGLTLKIPNYKHPYTPDFAYIDNSLNLHIDIEIDEPYDFDTKKPTHYLGAWSDSNRNGFFLGRNWVIIRFSEEQVIINPLSCCKEIAKTIVNITGDVLVLSHFLNIPDLQPMNQWTEEEAEEMASLDYRKSYRNTSLSTGQTFSIHFSAKDLTNILLKKKEVAVVEDSKTFTSAPGKAIKEGATPSLKQSASSRRNARKKAMMKEIKQLANQHDVKEQDLCEKLQELGGAGGKREGLAKLRQQLKTVPNAVKLLVYGEVLPS